MTDLDSPLRSFRTYTKQPPGTFENLHDKILLDVAGAPEGSRVRFLTLDRYDGEEWAPDNDTMAGTTDDRFQRMDTSVDNPTAGTALRVRVTVKKAYRSAWVPTVGSLTALRFLYADRYARRDELRYNVATSTAVLPLGVKPRNDYEFTSILAEDRLTPDMAAWPEPLLSVKEASRVDPLITRVLASPAPPMSKMFVLAKYLRDTGFYSDGAGPAEERFKPGHDVKRLFPGFLLAKRAVGDDEQYAAAMAVLANRVGVPARVVVGAVLPRSGRMRGSDVEAWVEVRIADGSWRTLATEQFMGDRPPTARLPPPPPPRMPDRLAEQPQQPPSSRRRRRPSARPNGPRTSGVPWSSASCPVLSCSSSCWRCRRPRRSGVGSAAGKEGPRTGWPLRGPSSWTMRVTSGSRSGCTHPGPRRPESSPARGPFPGKATMVSSPRPSRPRRR